MPQWVAGFCLIMREENDLQNTNSMLDYLISLFEYVQGVMAIWTGQS